MIFLYFLPEFLAGCHGRWL